MATTVTFLGHGTFLVETNGTNVLIDPFLTGNPAASTTAKDVPADVIILSHGHGDHVGDAIEVANRTGALVIANHEIVEALAARAAGCPRRGEAHRPRGQLRRRVGQHQDPRKPRVDGCEQRCGVGPACAGTR